MNTEAAKINSKAHHVTLQARERMEVHGVTDVISFDEQTVTVSTVCGNMEVGGSSLHIHVLNMADGIITLDGHIDSVIYYTEESDGVSDKNGFFKKLFR